MAARLLLLLFCLLSLAGCGRREASPPGRPAPAKTVTIGLIPEQNIFKQIARYEPLARYLAGKVGVEIELKILPRYGNIVDNFRSANLDGAFFGSFTYALAHEKIGVSVIARPVGLDNSSTYHGLIFVRKDSRIRTARDMRTARFAFVDKATTAGYLLPLEYFHENRIRDYRTYLREYYFAGTHEDAIYDVLSGKADVGAAKNTVFNRLADSDPRLRRELLVLKRSPEVPENGLALRKDLDERLKSRLKEALLDIHNDPEARKVLNRFGAARFIETTDRDYDVVFRYARDVRLDLARYDYVNY